MNGTNRYAVVVGVNLYERHPEYTLDVAESDAQRFGDFLKDQTQGGLPPSNVNVLKSPQLADLLCALSDVTKQIKANPGSTLILYFAGHGDLVGSRSLKILMRDSDKDSLAMTSFSVTEISALIEDCNPSASISIFDLCHSGAHIEGLAKLATNELSKADKNRNAVEGHYFLAACAPHETTTEGIAGGSFTRCLFDQIENVGLERPYEEFISVDTIANAVLKSYKQQGAKVHPTWSGISISRSIPLTRNKHWDSTLPRPQNAISLPDIVDAEKIKPFTKQLLSVSGLIGTNQPWAREGTAVLINLDKAKVEEETIRPFIGKVTESIIGRVNKHGNIHDFDELEHYLCGAVTLLAANGGLNCDELRLTAYLYCERSKEILQQAESWVNEKKWINGSDGIAQIAMAPMRFWDKLGSISLLQLSANVIGDNQTQRDCSTFIQRAVNSAPQMYRISWAGQYPDILVSLACAFSDTPDEICRVAKEFVDRILGDAKKGFSPAPVLQHTRETGKELAKRFLSASSNEDEYADEGLAVFLSLLAVSGLTEMEFNSVLGKVGCYENVGDFHLYVPKNVEAIFSETMSNCETKTWLRSSSESSSAFANSIAQFCTKPFLNDSTLLSEELFASHAAGRFFRNRANLGIASILIDRTKSS